MKIWRSLALLLMLAGLVTQAKAADTRPGTLLPPGYLSTHGSAIVDTNGSAVRLACVQWHGLNEKGSGPYGWGRLPLDQHLANMVHAGFNCIRIAWTDAGMTGRSMRIARRIVAGASRYGLRVILAHFNNEGVSHDPTGWACLAQQVNGLWFDRGPGTDNTDGCRDPGTVTAADFRRHWETVAAMFAGNPTVVAMDLDNEPTQAGHITWGDNGPTDMHAMCTTVGNAIQAHDPGVLIGCPCPMDYARSFARTGIAPEGDCTAVRRDPVVLRQPNKVFYIVHEYPKVISGIPVDSGPRYIRQMNAAWGYLVTDNIAPVWMGEGGASLDQWSKDLADEKAWAATIGPYLNGQAPGGLRIPNNGQGVGTCWMMWGFAPLEAPDGALEADWKTIKPAQAALFGQWRQRPLNAGRKSPGN